MKRRSLVIVIMNLFFLGIWLRPVWALEHTQKDGLFSMDVPAEWHWREFPQEIVITYPDGQTVAMDIQLIPSINLSGDGIKKTIKEGNDTMIHQGIEAHGGTLIDNKEITVGGVYATQLDFRTAAPNSIFVTYISFFNKGYAFTITYGSNDDKMRLSMDDAVATIKFK